MKSFTLIELLIVLVIIGIVATIALPQISKVVENSQMSQAYIKMDALRKAENIYFTECGDWLDIDQPDYDPDFDKKYKLLGLVPSDYRVDKFYRYWWGTYIYVTPDGKSHKPGCAAAAKVDGSGNIIYTSDCGLMLFDDDRSVWKVKFRPPGSVDYFSKRVN
jgi:prepilin-type N-terminal cleavage/methylation domain-containing protein